MKIVLLILLWVGLGACQPPNPATKTKTNTMDNTIKFREGAVGMIGEHKVMFSNIMLQDYTAQDGTAKEGLAARLSLPTQKEWITAGEGYVFELDGKSYEVVEIEDGSGRRSTGEVTVKEVE